MSSETPLQVTAFNDTLQPLIQDFMEHSTSLGDPLIEMALLVKEAFDQLANLIAYALFENQPADESSFFAQHPLSISIRAIQDFRNKHRNSKDFFNHLSSVSEASLALSWVAVRPAPKQFIADMIAAAEFYGNRVLTSAQFKGNQSHTSFTKTWYQILKELEVYVRQYFPTGLTWGSAQGGMVQPNPRKSNLGMTGAPPPPPPPPANLDFGLTSSPGSGDNRQALLADLNIGTGITNRLKHVNKGECKPSGPIAMAGKTASTYPKNQQPPAHSPKFGLEGRKWVVAYHNANPGLVLDNQDISESLLMHNCQDSYMEIKNKINNVSIDACKKTNLLVRGVISSVELIRCERVKIQCEGVVPLINIANCDQVDIYLNDTSRQAEVIASKSSAVNICFVKADGDYVEFPMPEQIRSVITQNNPPKLKSDVVDTI